MNEPLGSPEMPVSHEALREDLAAYALGGLDPAAVARVERHLRDCAACREIAREYAAVRGWLPLALDPVQPSRKTRAALQAALATGGARRGTGGLRLARARVRPLAVAWAAVAALLLVLAGWAYQARGPVDDPVALVRQLRARDGVRVVPLAGSPAAPAAAGQLLLPPDQSRGGLVVSGLPSLPPDRAYQLWFIRPDQTRASGGVFRVDGHGAATVAVPIPGDLGAYVGFGVTEEPAMGSPAPTGRSVLAAAH